MKVLAFHSVNETSKPVKNRVYRNDNTCPPGRDIPKKTNGKEAQAATGCARSASNGSS